MPNTHFDQVNAIREVFTYIRSFQNKVFLLKIEDSLLDHAYFPLLMKDIVQLHHTGIQIIIVPGTRSTIERLLEDAGQQTKIHEGIRLTHEKALPLVKLAAMEVTQRIISFLSANGANGLMGNWIKARSLGVTNGIDYQNTGAIESLKTDLIQELLDDGFIPIVPNIGWNTMGKAYNISSNELATNLCEALHVHKIFLIGIDEGIQAEGLTLPEGLTPSDNGILSALDLEQTHFILEHNDLSYNAKDYLKTAIQACKAGALRAHLISGLSEGSILQEVFSSRGEGTMVYSNQYVHIRQAQEKDIADILQLQESYAEKGLLLPRSKQHLLENIEHYVVFDVDGVLHGCAALHKYGSTAEIASVCVDLSQQSSGVGKKLVLNLIDQAKSQNFEKVFILTTQASDWFESLGFTIGPEADLPQERSYNVGRNSRILFYPL